MNKTNKELAVEIVTAIIRANPRITQKTGSPNLEQIVNGVPVETIDKLLRHYTSVMASLDAPKEQTE